MDLYTYLLGPSSCMDGNCCIVQESFTVAGVYPGDSLGDLHSCVGSEEDLEWTLLVFGAPVLNSLKSTQSPAWMSCRGPDAGGGSTSFTSVAT